MKKLAILSITMIVSLGSMAGCAFVKGAGPNSIAEQINTRVNLFSVRKATAKEKGEDPKNGAQNEKKSRQDQVLTINYDNYRLLDQLEHQVNFLERNWAKTKLLIDKVEVDHVKAKEYEPANDGKFQVNGFMRVHMSVTPVRDVNIYPSQAKAIFNNGEQQEATGNESWGGEIAKGTTKEGWTSFPIQHLAKAANLTTVRLKFSAGYDTADDADTGAFHDYDITLDLQR